MHTMRASALKVTGTFMQSLKAPASFRFQYGAWRGQFMVLVEFFTILQTWLPLLGKVVTHYSDMPL